MYYPGVEQKLMELPHNIFIFVNLIFVNLALLASDKYRYLNQNPIISNALHTFLSHGSKLKQHK